MIAKYSNLKIVFQFGFPFYGVNVDNREATLSLPPSGLQPGVSCVTSLPGLFMAGEGVISVLSERGIASFSSSFTK